MEADLRISSPRQGIGLIRLDAPERRNSITGSLARSLTAALREFDEDPEIGALVISGGQDAFCAGADRRVLTAAASRSPSLDLLSIYEIFSTLRSLGVPTVAAACGPAVGAGLNLALACDVRIAGTNALFQSMFLANSIQPAGGHLRMLEDIGGRSLAIRLAVFDQPLAAEAILAAGLATSVHEPHEVEAEAIHFASRAAGQPVLARAIKRSAVGVSRLTVEESADYEGAAQAATLRER